MHTYFNISLSRRTLEEAIEHLEEVVNIIKNYPQPDAYGEWHFSYKWPVKDYQEEEPSLLESWGSFAEDDEED